MHCLHLGPKLSQCFNFYKTLLHHDFCMGYYERPKVNLGIFTYNIVSYGYLPAAQSTLYLTLRFDIVGSSYGQTYSIRNSHVECSPGMAQCEHNLYDI